MYTEVHADRIEDRASAPEIRLILEHFRGCAGDSGLAPFERFNLSSQIGRAHV
jgi:hypothetical protein